MAAPSSAAPAAAAAAAPATGAPKPHPSASLYVGELNGYAMFACFAFEQNSKFSAHDLDPEPPALFCR